MTSEEALAIVEAALTESCLSKLQKTVFCHAWEEQSYLEIARHCGYELGYVKQTGSQLWQLLSQTFDEKVTKQNVQLVLKRKLASAVTVGREPGSREAAPYEGVRKYSTGAYVSSAPTLTLTLPTQVSSRQSPSFLASSKAASLPQIQPSTSVPPIPQLPRIDWGDAADVSAFYGRDAELAMLKQWIVQERCRLVGLFGMGGIGKTSLSIKLAKQILSTPGRGEPEFEYVIWRSLRNAPPIQDLLADLLQFLSDQQNTDLPDSLDGQMRRLLYYLRQHRCLIILDNGETVISQDNSTGSDRSRYEGYDQLWQRLGESDHQSSVVLTSREKPRGIAAQEGRALPIRSLRLMGLPPLVGQEIFNVKGDFTGSDQAWQSLIEHYAGNPLALKMVAPVIQDLFDGQIASFVDCLQEGTSIFGDIQDLLAQQINRLSNLEQQVMYWLAIARKPITLSQLRANFTPSVSLGQLLEGLTSLERRCLIDKIPPTLSEKNQTCFTLQPVVMEYMTERLIERICVEIGPRGEQAETGSVSSFRLPPSAFLLTHSLIQPQTKDYIRETQTRLILKPIAEQLCSTISRGDLESHFRQLLTHLRYSNQPIGYAGGNVVNLLCQLGIDLRGWDFSGLAVWNAYLRGASLHQVNFTGSDLSNSVFTETFSQILAIDFSPDGKLLATGDVNHEIHIWQVADGKQLLNCKIEEGWVWSVAFSPDGRLLASSANRTVKLWDVHRGECVQTLQGYTDRVFSVAFSPDGQLLATGSEDHLVRIWQVRTGQLLHTLEGHTDEVRSVAFSPSALKVPLEDLNSPKTAKRSSISNLPSPRWLLASGSYDGTVRLWNTGTGACLNHLKGHRHWVWSVAFSPDGRTLASGGDDRALKLWDVNSGRCLQSLLGHTLQIRSVAFSPDGRTLASGGDDRTLRIWDCRTGECLKVLTGHSSWIAAVAFSPDNGLLASGSEDQSVRLWDSRSSLCLKTLQGYSNGVWSVAFNADGTMLASGSQDRMIRLWQRNGELLATLQGHTSWVWSVVFSPTAPLLASGSEDHTIKIWDTRTHQLVQTLEAHQDTVLSVLFSPSGRTLISGSLDGTLKLWTVQTGRSEQVRLDQTLSGHTGGVWCIALSPDGTLLASGSQDQTVKLWDISTGRCLKTLLGHQGWVRCVAISPDQKTVVSGSADGVIKVWQIAEGICEQIPAHCGPVLSVAFHPDGKTFTSSGTDGLLKLWDTAQNQCRQILQGHDRWVRFLSYSPDGQTLASCSQDETIKLWQVSADSLCQFVSTPHTLRIPRPYEGMAITRVTGLTPAQKSTLRMLGAIEQL